MLVRLVAIASLHVALLAGAQAQTQPAQTPVRGGTAIIVVQADPGHLNPAISTGWVCA